MSFKTAQEEFWAGDFGRGYIDRNRGEHLINSNIHLFGKILSNMPRVSSFVEFGCNIGLNLQALHRINHEFNLCGYEINRFAAEQASALNIAKIVNKTILDNLEDVTQYDVSFTKGVLIHINPVELTKVYDNLYNLSRRYILVSEYYNPSPVSISYRGEHERLFKRDFAGELIDRFNMRLVNYGFSYHRDHYFPQDDESWFLLEK